MSDTSNVKLESWNFATNSGSMFKFLFYCSSVMFFKTFVRILLVEALHVLTIIPSGFGYCEDERNFAFIYLFFLNFRTVMVRSERKQRS